MAILKRIFRLKPKETATAIPPLEKAMLPKLEKRSSGNHERLHNP